MAYINLIILNLIICFSLGAKLQNDVPIDNYTINFKIKNAGSTVTGSFKGLKLKYSFDEDNLNTSFFEGILAVSSIKTGIDMRDRHLKKSEYFNVSSFPEITLQTSKIEKESGNNYKITCKLSIKGITKTITVPATIIENDNFLSISSQFDLNRLDFGLGNPSIVMAKNVLVSIEMKINRNEK
jgi:polyisoprenoid-binding protein YceI